MHTRQIPNAERVQTVRLLDAEAIPVPTGSSAAPGPHWEAKRAQLFYQHIAHRIQRSGIPKWSLRQSFNLRVPKFVGRSVSFGGIAGVTTKGEIRRSV
jgi:hypothetical protein